MPFKNMRWRMQRVLRITNRSQEQSTCEHRKHQQYKQLRNRKKKKNEKEMDRELFHRWNKNNDKRVIIQLKSSIPLHTSQIKGNEKWKEMIVCDGIVSIVFYLF